MTLRLVIEHSVHPQRQSEMSHPGGEFSIGRGAECSWQLEDPEMYVSRKHCVITGEAGRFIVTDASRGGLFLDGRDTPLGPGNSAALEPGMRMRLGDIVIRVQIEAAPAPAPRPSAPMQTRMDVDDFFSAPVTPPPVVQRPEALPQPFETGAIDARGAARSADRPPSPPLFDDPFSLDHTTPGRPTGAVPEPIRARSDDFGFGSFFDDPPRPQAPSPPVVDDWALPVSVETGPEPSPAVDTVTPEPPKVAPAVEALSAEPLRPQVSEPQPVAVAPDSGLSDTELRDAFFKGLGLDPTALSLAGTPEEMEALGKRFRLLVEGLMLMMRTRAREKQNARVAQTLIGSADVNPLKFLAATDDVLAALITPRGAGYLAPDDAINAAFRDLADHQMRSWVAMQTALRKMIDRFDPAAVEREMEETGTLQSLLSGGRNANLWRLYNERYKDIARAAEDRFLGEVGANFRDAYEGNREKIDDK